MKYIKSIFFVFLVLVIGYIFIGELVLPGDVVDTRNVLYKYDEDWYQIYADGEKQKIEVPGKIDTSFVIETTLPEDMDERVTTFCFKSQDLVAYLDGEEIFSYSTEGHRWFGKRSMLAYLTIPLPADAAGKTLRLEGVIGKKRTTQPFIGTELSIWLEIIKDYEGEIAISFVVAVLGFLVVIISIGYEIATKRSLGILYSGIAVTIVAAWLCTNSVFREVFFENLSIGDDSPVLMIMIMPFPFIISLNTLQEGRYIKQYVTCSILMATMNVLAIALYINGYMELGESLIYIIIGCVCCMMTVIGTIIRDGMTKQLSSYLSVAIGFIGLIITMIIQFIIYYASTGMPSGAVVAFGLMWFLGTAVLLSIRSIFSMEKDKTAALMANEAKGNFLAKMSHEIRTPINAVLGMNEMILRETNDPKIRDYAMDIHGAGKSLLSIINDILDISKIESGNMEVVPVEYDFSSLINDTVAMVTTKAKTKNLQVNTDISPALPCRMIGDDIRLRQILVNLLNNAVKYTEKGSVSLIVSGERFDGFEYLTFKVKDTGIGIRSEDMDKLFKSYKRIDEKNNRNIEGTGLGLNIASQLLELMDSKLEATSVYGEGTCMYFTVKQIIVDEDPIGELSARIKNQETDFNYDIGFTAENAHVLVVDDNAVNRKVVINLLKDTKIKLTEADSGEECIRKITEFTYDLILLDHMMPNMDGIQTLHAIRGMVNNPNREIPVIALTANAVTGAKEMYLANGFTDFLSKPIAYDKLEEKLIQFLPKDKVSEGVHVEKALSPGAYDASELSELIEGIPLINLKYAVMNNGSVDAVYDIMVDFINVIDFEADKLEKSYRKIVELVDNKPEGELSEELKAALSEYRIQVHSMKSSAGMIGAMSISGVAQMAEFAAADEDIETLISVSPSFIKAWRAFKEVLSPISDREASHRTGSSVSADMEVVKDQLNQLLDAMYEMDVDRADVIVAFLKSMDYPKDVAEKMNNLYAAVLNLDEEAVKAIVGTF